MADVFVSYARIDAPIAMRIAESLKAAGYDVWWDSELLPHHAFAQSIEAEIRGALAVVVVWSDHALRSQWVRAEADLARSQGKLVQVSIDQSALPLPFNQYQTADLGDWKGSPSDPRWLKVLASVAQLTHGPPEAPPAPTPSTRRSPLRERGINRWTLAAALAAFVALLALGGVWLVHSALRPPARGTRIAVRPYEVIGGATALRDFAAGLSESLQDTLNQDQLPTVSTADAQTLQGPDLLARLKALDVGLLLTGTVQISGEVVTVRTRLEDPMGHATLWTADITGSSQGLRPLQAQVGGRTVAVLNCSAQALNRKNGIDEPEILALFLHACDLAEISRHGALDVKIAFAMLDAMRAVARKAPNFAPGHSTLARHDAFLASDLPGQEAALRQEADREAHRALELDPKDPDAFVTFGLLVPSQDFGQRERWFRQALAVDQSWPNANGFLGDVMLDLGRVREASALFQRADSVNPLSPDWSNMAALGLLYAGETNQADRDLAGLSELRPGDPAIWDHQLQSLVVQRRWADALALLKDSNANPTLASYASSSMWRAVSEAMARHNATAISALRQKYVALGATDPQAAMLVLPVLGFVDDAFTVAQGYQPDRTDEPNWLFGPRLAATPASWPWRINSAFPNTGALPESGQISVPNLAFPITVRRRPPS